MNEQEQRWNEQNEKWAAMDEAINAAIDGILSDGYDAIDGPLPARVASFRANRDRGVA